MKRMSFFVFLSMVIAVFMSPGSSESGEWPNIGHTEYEGTKRGGMDSTTSYYQGIWEGAQAHKAKTKAPKSPIIEKKPDFTSPSESERIPVVAPPVTSAVSNMPSSPSPNTSSVAPANSADEDWRRGIKFIWPKAR